MQTPAAVARRAAELAEKKMYSRAASLMRTIITSPAASEAERDSASAMADRYTATLSAIRSKAEETRRANYEARRRYFAQLASSKPRPPNGLAMGFNTFANSPRPAATEADPKRQPVKDTRAQAREKIKHVIELMRSGATPAQIRMATGLKARTLRHYMQKMREQQEGNPQ